MSAAPQTRSRFLQRLEAGPTIVADGGMGALLSAAVPRLRCAEEANLRAPDAVVSLHVSFINAGAELIETNSFGANRPKLAQHFIEDQFDAINNAAVRLARDVLPEPWSVPGPVAKLRPRERGILELLADGLSTKEVAEALVISPHTVRTHVKLALRRLGVHTREEAAAMVRAHQLAQLV